MSGRTRTIARFVWNAWGIVSLAAAVVLVGIGVRAYRSSSRVAVDESRPEDVRFVLNWADLSAARVEAVEHSYESARSVTGDHLDAYAIRVSGIPDDAFRNADEPRGVRWVEGSAAASTLREAIELVAMCAAGDRLAWFPPGDQLASRRFLVTPWAVGMHAFRVTSAQLTFYDRDTGLIYYASCKT